MYVHVLYILDHIYRICLLSVSSVHPKVLTFHEYMTRDNYENNIIFYYYVYYTCKINGTHFLRTYIHAHGEEEFIG